MTRWSKAMWTLVPVLLVAAASYAAITTLNGEVTKYESGKSISVIDSTGNILALEITKDTKVVGEVRVGSKVMLEVDGMKVKSVKSMVGGPGSDGLSGG